MFGCRERVGAVLIAASLGGLMVQFGFPNLPFHCGVPASLGSSIPHKHYAAPPERVRMYFTIHYPTGLRIYSIKHPRGPRIDGIELLSRDPGSAQPLSRVSKLRDSLARRVQHSPSAEAYFDLVSVSVIERNYPRALRELNAVLFINPRFGAAYVQRAFVYGMLGDYHCALRDYDSAIAVEPKAAWLEERGRLKFSKFNDAAGALVDVERSLKMESTCESALELRTLVKNGLSSAVSR